MTKEVNKKQLNQKLMMILLPKIHSGDIFNLNTDTIAQLLNISKATLYKIYPSKKDIYITFIDDMIDFIDHDQLTKFNDEFPMILNRIFSSVVLISTNFLVGLKNKYPDLYTKINNSLSKQDELIVSFYRNQINKGSIRNINPKLILIQQQETIRYVVENNLFIKNGISIEQFVNDFHQMQTQTLFVHYDINDESLNHFIKHVTQKIKSVLINY